MPYWILVVAALILGPDGKTQRVVEYTDPAHFASYAECVAAARELPPSVVGMTYGDTLIAARFQCNHEIDI